MPKEGLKLFGRKSMFSCRIYSTKAPILSRKVSQLQLVAANLGISIVPEEFKQILPNKVKLLPLSDDLSFSEVFLVYRKDQDEMIQHCAEQIHQMFRS